MADGDLPNRSWRDLPDNIRRPKVRVPAFWRTLPAGMRRRWWLFRPFDLIARNLPTFRKPKGVLVVRMDGIGDMMLFRASLDGYAEAFGVDKRDVTVLGCESWGPIADRVFAGYRVIAINEHAYARRLLYRFAVSIRVRMLGAAVAVCDSYLRRAMMADSLVWVSGAPRTVVSMPYVNESTRAEFSYYLSQADEIINTGDYPTHEVERHARFMSALLGRDVAPAAPSLDWPCDRPARAGEGPYAVLVPGSNEPGRRWPFAKFAELAERLVEGGRRVFLVGQPNERPDPEAMARLTARPGIDDLSGRTTLSELLDLMRHADLVVANDTGPAHLSIAIGAPTLVIVGGGHFTSFVPYPPTATPANARFVHHRMPCYHCFWRCDRRATKRDVFPCIEAIGTDAVWPLCEDLLAKGPA